MIRVFYCGFDTLFPADAKYPFIIYLYIIITFQIISNSAVSFIRRLCMYFFNFFCNVEIFNFMDWYFSMKPFVISGSAYISQLTKFTNRIVMSFILFFDCPINRFVF